MVTLKRKGMLGRFKKMLSASRYQDIIVGEAEQHSSLTKIT